MGFFSTFQCLDYLFNPPSLDLQQQKQNVEDLQRGVAAAKDGYKSAMVQLERISEEIHSQRNLPLPIREPGVGCETEEFVTEIDLGKVKVVP